MATLAERAAAAGMTELEVAELKDVESENRMDAADKTDDKAEEKVEEKVEDKAEAKTDDNGDDGKEPPKTEAATSDEEDKDDEPQRQTPFVPTYAADSPEGLADRLKAIKAEQKDAVVKFGAGEFTAEEYADRNEALQTERESIVNKQGRIAAAQQYSQQTIQQAIEHERKAFIRDAKKEGIDYSNPMLRAALDTAFTTIVQDPKNASRGVDDAYSTFEEAHQAVKTAIGWKPPVATPKAPEPKTPAKETAPPPKTLAGIPAAAPASTGNDVMDKINTLEGEDLEVFLAKMSPADRKALRQRAQ